MNREIKFRAWDGKEMWQSVHLLPGDVYGPKGWKEVLLESGNWHWMQYTGLKDKHGKEIYEGDILTFDPANGAIRKSQTVIWNGKTAKFEAEGPNPYWPTKVVTTQLYGSIHRAEVIGNIWQEPELLEDKS